MTMEKFQPSSNNLINLTYTHTTKAQKFWLQFQLTRYTSQAPEQSSYSNILKLTNTKQDFVMAYICVMLFHYSFQ